MRLAISGVSVIFATIVVTSFPAFAQQAPEAPAAPPPAPAAAAPPAAVPPAAPTTVGVAPPVNQSPVQTPDPAQEVPLAPVKAAPCSVFARETDGTTTCIGIPSQSRGARRRR
jgi:hypothetical protein